MYAYIQLHNDSYVCVCVCVCIKFNQTYMLYKENGKKNTYK